MVGRRSDSDHHFADVRMGGHQDGEVGAERQF